MRLHILGSSSKGNSYILESESSSLILECGIPLLEVKKALDFDLSKIVACLVSHCHGDHAKYTSDFLKAGIDVYSSAGTFKELGIVNRRAICVKNGIIRQIGDWAIMPFDAKHDAPEPFGFLINHEECGSVLFLTDSYYSPYKFKNLNNIMLEINYDMDILNESFENGSVHPMVRNRIVSSHMNLDTAKGLLQANDLGAVNNILLLHLSDRNSNSRKFKQEIEELTGKTVTVADKGMIIELNKTPF